MAAADLRRLLVDNHEPRERQRHHIRKAIDVYRSLREAGIVVELDEPDSAGRMVAVGVDLQDRFALHQPLSLFALEVIPELVDRPVPAAPADHADPAGSPGADDDVAKPDEPDQPAAITVDPDAAGREHALDVLSVIESVLENPGVVIAAQVHRLKGELVARLKMEGVEYEERMERLNDVEAPKPLREFLYGTFDVFRNHHPWVGDENVKPKSVARELYETGYDFPPVHRAPRPETLRGCRPAIPLSGLQGTRPERTGGIQDRSPLRPGGVAGRNGPPDRLQPPRRVGEVAQSRRDTSRRRRACRIRTRTARRDPQPSGLPGDDPQRGVPMGATARTSPPR